MNAIAKPDSPGAFALAIKGAREQLEKCRDYSEAKEIRDAARALQVYARAKEDGVAAQNAAAAVVLKAEACMGRMLREVPRIDPSEAGRKGKGVNACTPSAKDLGTDRKTRQLLEDLAVADDAGKLDEYIAETKATGERISRNAALERVKPHVTNNSGKADWYTPPEWVEMAREVLGEIGLDPASSAAANKVVRARRFFDENADGLSPRKKWGGRVWMNPPYGQPECGQFIDRLLDEWEAQRVIEAIVLVNNGTETKWGQRLLRAASAVCFPEGRISFVDAQGGPSKSPLQGQMIVYLGENGDKFAEVFGTKGVVRE